MTGAQKKSEIFFLLRIYPLEGLNIFEEESGE